MMLHPPRKFLCANYFDPILPCSQNFMAFSPAWTVEVEDDEEGLAETRLTLGRVFCLPALRVSAVCKNSTQRTDQIEFQHISFVCCRHTFLPCASCRTSTLQPRRHREQRTKRKRSVLSRVTTAHFQPQVVENIAFCPSRCTHQASCSTQSVRCRMAEAV